MRFVRCTDGHTRRMACLCNPEAAARALYRFNPVERGAPRFVNLDTVESVKKDGVELALAQKPPKARRSRMVALDAEMDAPFNNQSYLG